ncbi:MAG: hypothetical protein VB064_10220 [Oscillospiraceae bacterium]|nr:hypothetical protein [Oscillospiraceae bacterium]
MLKIKNTANNTGISVSGCLEDMNELHDAISNVIGDDGEYFFEASSRQRLLDICREIRHATQEKREALNDEDFSPYAFRVLWPEAAFTAAVLDNFILLSSAKKFYAERLPEELSKSIQTVSSSHVALIHYFQELIWNELDRVVGAWQVKAIFGDYNELRKIHFKFPQFDGYCTQWLDLLNLKYLCSDPGRRRSHLAPILTKLFCIDEDYLSLKNDIDVFARQKGIRLTGVRLDENRIKKCEW